MFIFFNVAYGTVDSSLRARFRFSVDKYFFPAFAGDVLNKYCYPTQPRHGL